MTDHENDHNQDPLLGLAGELRALGSETEAQRTAKQVVPWIGSFMVHAAVLIVAVLVAGTVRLIQDTDDRPPIVADFDALTYDPLTALERPKSEVQQELSQNEMPTEEITEVINDQLLELEVDLSQLISDAASAPQMPQFQHQEMEAAATFVGLKSSNARRIVYVIDGSGSLIALLQIVVQELSRSLEALTARQEFGIVFFQQDKALAAPPGNKLHKATSAEKARALEWIDRTIIPSGNSNPLPALELALRLKPDVIFVLSDNITGAGQYEIDQNELLERLDQLNPRHKRSRRRAVAINCIQFLDPDPLNTLARIAEEHGGPNGYKFLDREELGLVRPN